jgi:hypothetical protein
VSREIASRTATHVSVSSLELLSACRGLDRTYEYVRLQLRWSACGFVVS